MIVRNNGLKSQMGTPIHFTHHLPEWSEPWLASELWSSEPWSASESAAELAPDLEQASESWSASESAAESELEQTSEPWFSELWSATINEEYMLQRNDC
jgi:hypothetical protein